MADIKGDVRPTLALHQILEIRTPWGLHRRLCTPRPWWEWRTQNRCPPYVGVESNPGNSHPVGRTSPFMYAATMVGMADTKSVSALRWRCIKSWKSPPRRAYIAVYVRRDHGGDGGHKIGVRPTAMVNASG